MKKQNLVFGGVMAAILFGGSANAATTIATQAYVDKAVKPIETLQETVTTLQTNMVTESDLTGYEQTSNKASTITSANSNSTTAYPTVGAVVSYLNDLDIPSTEGLSTMQSDINTLKGDEETPGSVANQIATALEDFDVDGKQPVSDKDYSIGNKSGGWTQLTDEQVAALDSGVTAETVAALTDEENGIIKTVDNLDEQINGTDGIADAIETIGNTVSGIGDDVTALQTGLAKKADLITGVTPADIGKIATIGENGQYVMSASKLADLATSDGIANAISDATADGIASGDDGLATSGQVYSYAIPKPQDECNADSTMCVLTTTTGGTLAWVAVTKPLEETAGTGNGQ